MAEPLNADKLAELIEKLPAPLRPAAAKYGSLLLQMSYDEVWNWIALLIAGKTEEAWNALYANMAAGDMEAAGLGLIQQWQEANVANAAKLELQREAAMAVLRVMLSLALAMVGL